MNPEQYDKWLTEDRIWFGKKNTARPMLKRFLVDAQKGLTPNTWWNHEFAGHNKEATLELKEMFEGDAPFDTPKPVRLLKRILQIFSDPNSLVLDSFAGSGTTAHAVLAQNMEDGGNRSFVLVEIEDEVARSTSTRVNKAVSGYSAQKTRTSKTDVPGLGGGFRYCKLSNPIFDENGHIHPEVRFADLAAHVFFTETGEPIPKRPKGKQPSPLTGVCNGVAVYLLFNGVLGDKRRNGGNILTGKILEELPVHDGPKVIYGEGCRLGSARLKREGITFKQVPYEIKVS